jgi:hypothetical protein
VSRLPARRVLGCQDGVGISRLITGLTSRLRLAPAVAPLRLLRPAKPIKASPRAPANVLFFVFLPGPQAVADRLSTPTAAAAARIDPSDP